MPRLFLLLSCFLFFLNFPDLLAQKGYEPGYVVTKTFDTIPGSIKDRKGPPFAKIYKKIRFKGNSLFVKKYSPKQIQGYARGEDIFESQWIQVSSRFFKTDYLSRENQGKKHFLKVKESGYLTYYQWDFMDQESSVVEWIDLFKRRHEDYFVRVIQGILGLKMNQLSDYFEDCPELMEKIRNKELRTPMEITRFYNEWVKGGISEGRKK